LGDSSETQVTNPPDPWDWVSFGWGIVAGGIIIATVGGAVLYLTWPYIFAFLKTVPVFKEMVAAARERGFLK